VQNFTTINASNAGSDSKEERFERLAMKRTGDILKKLKLLGNLSNKNNYLYTEGQIREMFAAIDREIRLARERFNTQISKGDPEFRFSKRRT
jgi:hypothetical protein